MLLRERSAINFQSYPIINNLFSTHQNTRRAICYNDLRSEYAADGMYRGAVISFVGRRCPKIMQSSESNQCRDGQRAGGSNSSDEQMLLFILWLFIRLLHFIIKEQARLRMRLLLW